MSDKYTGTVARPVTDRPDWPDEKDCLTVKALLEAQRRVSDLAAPQGVPFTAQPNMIWGQPAYFPPDLQVHVVRDLQITREFWFIEPAHPIVRWLAKYLKISPWSWFQGEIDIDAEDAWVHGDRLYLTARVWGALKATRLCSPTSS